MEKHKFKYEPVNMFRPNVWMDQVRESKTGNSNVIVGFVIFLGWVVLAGLALWFNSFIK